MNLCWRHGRAWLVKERIEVGESFANWKDTCHNVIDILDSYCDVSLFCVSVRRPSPELLRRPTHSTSKTEQAAASDHDRGWRKEQKTKH